MNQQENNAPMTQGQFHQLHSLMLQTDRKVDNLQNDMSQLKRDINVIANEIGLKRDDRDQLRKIA